MDDDELRLAKQDTAWGPRQRAAIIETLLKRAYVRREQKALVATAKGIVDHDAPCSPLSRRRS